MIKKIFLCVFFLLVSVRLLFYHFAEDLPSGILHAEVLLDLGRTCIFVFFFCVCLLYFSIENCIYESNIMVTVEVRFPSSSGFAIFVVVGSVPRIGVRGRRLTCLPSSVPFPGYGILSHFPCVYSCIECLIYVFIHLFRAGFESLRQTFHQ